jgi:hypothetical protein
MGNMAHAARGLVMAVIVGTLAACGAASGTVTDPGALASRGADDGGGAAGASAGSSPGIARLRCEVRSGRSKISLDGKNLSPRNGTFSARVEAAGGTATASATAVGDEVEFDFDSERDDVAQGATAIAANFIVARSGPDVTGEITNAQGQVVARAAVECEIR